MDFVLSDVRQFSIQPQETRVIEMKILLFVAELYRITEVLAHTNHLQAHFSAKHQQSI